MVIEAKIDDLDRFMEYARQAAKLVEQFGGHYIIRGAEPVSLEGEWPTQKKLVISKWHTQQDALAFWNSPEYAKLKKIRLGTARVRVTLFEGSK